MVHGAKPNLGMSAKKWCMEKRVASGYEKKARADEENLLNKEKHKEKKHKKEKKDREKREGKEKNEKDRSEEKHKEKKERKDKHKDKKDKHKDKERKSVLAEKDTARAQEHDIAKKLGPSSVQSAQSSDTNFLLELGKRIGNDDGRSAEKNLLVHKFTLTGPGNHDKRSKDKGEDQRKVNGRQNGVVAATSFIQKFEGVHQGTLVEKSLMAENGFVQKFEGEHRGTLEGVGGVVEKSVEKPREHEENNKQNNGESSGGEQKERDHGKKIRVGLLVEKPIEKRTEQEESNKQKNGESRAGKHKDKDPERKSKPKDKKGDKEKEKEERKEKKEKRKEKELKKEQLKQRESRKPAADGDNMKTSSDLLKERSQQSGGEGNVGKRKEFETNGFLHDAGIRPSKLARPASSTHQIVENGRITEPCKTAIRFVEDLEGNKKISSSPSVPRNEKILEPSPRTISSTHQLIIVNGRKPEPSKTAIRTVAEFGDGNKKVTPSLSVATNGKVTKPCPRPKPDVFTKELMENGSELEPGKAAVHVETEGEGNSKQVLSSISVAGTGSKMEPPTPSLPAPENGRKIELSRSSDQSTTVRNMVVDNHKVGSKEIVVNCKEAVAQQPNVSLKRHSLSSKQVKEKVKPKPPHPDSKLLDSIFSVPKVERSDFDDQEWLFGSSDLQQAKRPKVGSSQVEETTKQQKSVLDLVGKMLQLRLPTWKVFPLKVSR